MRANSVIGKYMGYSSKKEKKEVSTVDNGTKDF